MGAIFNSYSFSDNADYILSCNDYMNYIKEHKNNVMKSYYELFVNHDWRNKLPEEISIDDWNDALLDLEEEVKNHDNSKYEDIEFEPYRRHFHKTTSEDLADKKDEFLAQMVDEDFEKAWIHHCQVNPHHPEFWLYTDIVNGDLVALDNPRKDGPRDMNLLNILHMICDWSAMSIKFRQTYSPVSWYNTSAAEHRKAMSDKTRHLLYLILIMLFPNEEVIE